MYKLSRFSRFLLPLALAALIASGLDLSGKWTGTIVIHDSASGTKIETPVELNLEQKGGVLSGKISRESDPEKVEIRNPRIEGDRFSFEASSEETQSSMRFSLKVQGETMQGDMKGAASGNDIVAKVSFTRMK
ncbi:MAG TPA: hypothetical protein VL285_04740 [Bryobacteraceae bacterium]|jgi:hypothetical protein|nr:hypothetical protein [Bryobacteraceae bacterium]